ncbi:hypothetical protein SAMN05216548_12632 [Faunimonas pinastri]|uniref:Uncharacterized protein n=1 Tax=Faunimonas pinastri TaxID=1855383 RepID=A0A1H9QCJ9_9HYPH|nr:hypothetical protein [Faunimonas pinastri]SER57543.1 hypothetical protein SAMN05216548_12632 [Faunimonas pinastri]
MKALLGILVVPLLAMGAAHAADERNASQYLQQCPYVGDQRVCEQERQSFADDLRRAFQGEYTPQRNVAYCLQTSCDGAVRPNRIQACAWRIVVMSSGSSEVDDSDEANLQRACGELSPAGLEAAKTRAQVIADHVDEPVASAPPAAPDFSDPSDGHREALVGQSYAAASTALLGFGWKRSPVLARSEPCTGFEQVCAIHPEVSECFHKGDHDCYFAWRDSKNMMRVVVTDGQDPARLTAKEIVPGPYPIDSAW